MFLSTNVNYLAAGGDDEYEAYSDAYLWEQFYTASGVASYRSFILASSAWEVGVVQLDIYIDRWTKEEPWQAGRRDRGRGVE